MIIRFFIVVHLLILSSFAADSAAVSLAPEEKFLSILEDDENNYDALYGLAEYYHGNDEPEKAITYFNKSLSVNNKNKGTYLKLARLYQKIGAPEASLEFYQRYIKEVPDDIDALKELSEIYRKSNQPEKASAVINDAISRNPDNKALRHFQADRLLDSKDTAAALNVLKEVLRKDPGDTASLKILSTVYANRGNLKEAAVYLAGLYEIYPADDSLAFLFGRALIKAGKQNRAAEVYEKLYNENRSEEAASNLVSIYRKTGNKDKLADILKKTVKAEEKYVSDLRFLSDYFSAKKDKTNSLKYSTMLYNADKSPESALLSAKIYHSEGNSDKALEYYGKYLELKKDTAVQRAAGELAVRNKDTSAALSWLGEYYKQNSENAELTEMLAGLLKTRKRNDNENDTYIRVVKKVLEKKPDSFEWNMEAGRAYMRSDDFAKAASAFNNAALIKKSSPLPRYRLGEALKKNNDINGAVSAFKKAFSLSPSEKKYAVSYARALADKNDFKTAAEVYSSILNNSPGDVSVHLELAGVYSDAGQSALAARHFEKADSLNPDGSGGGLDRAEVYFKLEKYEKALPILEKLSEEGAENPEVFLMLAKIYEERRNTAARVSALINAAKLDSSDTGSRIKLADYYLKQNNHSEAEKMLLSAFSVDSTNTLVMKKLSDVYRKSGNDEKLLDILLKAESAGEGSFELYKETASLFYEKQEFKQAAAYYGKMSKEKPDNREALIMRARSLVKSNDTVTALDSYAEYLKLSPSDGDAAENYGMLLFRSGKKEKGALWLSKALDAGRKNKPVLETLAEYYKAAGNNDEYKRVKKQLAVIDPADAEALVILAEEYESAGRYSEAEKNYLKALAAEPENKKAIRGAGMSMAMQEKYAKALPYLRKSDGKSAGKELKKQLGISLLESADTVAALSAFEEYFDINRNTDIDTRLKTARLYRASKKPLKAVTHYKKLLGSSADTGKVLTEIAEVYKEAGKNDSALNYFRRSSIALPSDKYPRIRAGKILFEQAEYSASAEYFKNAYLKDPADNELKLLLAKAYYRDSSFSEAAEFSGKVLASDSASAEAAQIAASSFKALGQPDKSAPFFTLIEKHGGRPTLMMGETYYKSGKPEKGATVLEKVTADSSLTDQERERAAFILSEIYRELGQKEKLAASLEKYLEISGSPDALRELGFIYASLKKNEKAIDALLGYDSATKKAGVDEYILLDSLYEISGNIKGRITALKNLLGASKKTSHTRLKLAEIYYGQKEYDSALVYSGKTVAADPGNARAILIQARSYSAMEKIKEALSKYSKAVTLMPSETDVRREYGLLLFKEGREMDAAGELELVVRENKTDSEILKILSRIYESTGDLMSLNRINTLRLDIEPENPEALVRKGIFLDSRDSSDKALSQYEKALKTDPENSKALERAADIYQEKGKTAKSAEYYKRALADTSSNRLLLKYSKALIAENRIDDAKKSLELITARDTSFHSAYYLLGKILMSEKNYDNAATNAGTAVKLSPDNMDYISLLADALYLAGKYPEALPQYMKIISSEKAGAEDYYRAGNILKQQKNYSKSLPLLEKARLLMPSEKKYLEEYASVSYSSKDYKKSAELYQKLLDKNPDEAVFNYRASVSLIKSGQREEALSYIRKAYGKSPEMYEGDTAAARVLYGGGEYGKAVNILETVASNDNTPVSILRLYANSLKEKGNSEKAGDIVVSMNRRNGKNDLLKEAGELYSEASRDSLSSLYYEEYLKSSPRDTSVLLKQLKYYRKKENADGTFKTLERLFAAVPDRSAYTEEYTAQLNRRNKYRESIIAAERFFKLQPSSTDAGIYLNLARAYSATGNNRSALERYSSALRYSPSDIKARREYAELLAKQGLKKKAAENYQKILESDEADTSDAYALAEIYGDLKNTEGLKKTLEKIVEMAPEDHQSRRKLADMRYLGKEYEDAISHYEILIDKNHTDAVLFINTGNIYLAGKDTSSAVKNYEAAVKADPSLDRIHYRLAGLYKATSLTDKALQSALMTVKNDSLNAGAHIMAAEIYKNKGNHKEAAASYKKASAVRPKDTEILHELAKQLVQAGSKDSSIMVYRSILTLNSDDNEAVEKLGSLLYEKAYYKKAVPHLRRSYLNSNKQKILNMLGRALYETKEYVEASKYLKKMHLLAPSEIDIQHMLAVSYLKTGEKDLALQYYLKVNREKPSLIKNEKEAAALFFNTGKYKEAERIFRNIAKTEKKDSDAFYFLGRIAEEKNPEEAIQNYEKAYNLNSEREDLVKRLGLIYASTGRDQMSLFYLNKLVEENKADEEALLALLKLYSKAGDEDNRQKTLFKLIKKDPKNPDYVKSYSRILIDKKQFDLAARYLNGAISLDPKDDESYYLRALVYEGKNWLKSARSNMALAVKYRSSNLQYRKEYGRILVKSNWHKTAAKQYEFIIRNDPKSSWAAEELLNIYKKTGNRAGLNKTAQMLAALDPNSVPARKILADRFYRSGEYSSAAVEFEKLDKIIKDDKDIKDKLAVSLYKTGKNKKALEVLTESLKMDSSNWKLQGMKGDILKKRGEKDPALEAYKLAVKHNPEDHSSHFAAAQILEEKGRAGEALVSAEKASEISAGNTDYRMLAGELNYKSGNTDDALKHLGFVISKEPKNQTANYLAGKIYLGKKRPKAAVDFLETAYMLDPASQEKAALYAEALYRAGMYTKAMPVLKKYSDGNIDLKSFLGAALYKTGKKDSAASVFSEVYGSNPDKLSGMPEAAHSLYGSGEKKKSQRILESALQAGNAEIEDRELLAEIYKENKNWEKAASVYEKLYSDNKKPEYKKQLGLVYEKSGKLSEAARALREYTSRVPRDGDAFNKLIKLYRETGNTAEINAILPKAVEADPQNPDLRFAYAEYLIQKNNYSAAEAQLNILVGKHTSHAEGFHLLGIVMINKNWLKSATTYFAKAVELAPSSTEMRKSYADILYRRELKTAAAKEYKKILENQPGDSSAVERLGEIYRKTGKENELFELYKKEYDIVKGNLQVHKFLGGIYASNNQINDAVFEYEKALEIKKTDTEVLKKLGFLYKKQGKTDRAINSYMQLSKFIEDSPEVHYRLGDLFLDDQNYTLAMMKLQECLNLDPRHKMANFKLGMVYYNLRENSREYAKKSLEYFEKYMSLGGKKENIPVEMRNYIK